MAARISTSGGVNWDKRTTRESNTYTAGMAYQIVSITGKGHLLQIITAFTAATTLPLVIEVDGRIYLYNTCQSESVIPIGMRFEQSIRITTDNSANYTAIDFACLLD